MGSPEVLRAFLCLLLNYVHFGHWKPRRERREEAWEARIEAPMPLLYDDDQCINWLGNPFNPSRLVSLKPFLIALAPSISALDLITISNLTLI